ncbi:MAG: alpha/beta fold hydrolase [Caulobacteraceae bacterium]
MAALEFGPADRPVDLIFLHANGFNALAYRAILAPLAAGRRMMAIDQRGHGATTLAIEIEGRTNWHDFRDDLLALLAVLDLKDVVLAGHSMGGTSSLLAAAEAPGRVRSLVLFDPVFLPPGTPADEGEVGRHHASLIEGTRRRRAVFPGRAAALAHWRGRGAFTTWPDAMVADFVAGAFRDRPGGEVALACEPAWEASTYAAHGHDPWAAFERSACPIRILRAEQGSTCRVEGKIEALTASGRISIQTVAGTTHFLPMERPDLARAALAEAMDGGSKP